MTPPVLHPGFERLSGYADQDLDARSQRRVARHLEHCSVCRERIRFLRAVDDAARQLPVPDPPIDLLDHILEDRRSGARVILPVSDPAPKRERRRRVALLAGLTMTVAVAVTVLLSVHGASADRSEMSFQPAEPVPGGTVHVVYHASSLFAGQPVLRLRARLRATDGQVRREVIARLVRQKGDVFRAAFELPQEVSYAAFAVETPDGTLVDSNGRRLWDLMTSDGAGKPTPSALEQRVEDVLGRDWSESLKTARRFTSLYADRPEGWRLRLALEREVTEPDARDSLLAEYRRRFERLDRELRSARSIRPGEVQAMYFLALSVGSAEERAFWSDRLVKAMPDAPATLDLRLNQLVAAGADRPRALLKVADSIQRAAGTVPSSLAMRALNAALQVGDVNGVRAWTSRLRLETPEDVTQVVDEALQHPSMRQTALQQIDEYVEHLRSGVEARRPLDVSRPEQRRLDIRAAQSARAGIGTLLLAQGRARAAADTLEHALLGGWNPDVFRTAAAARLEVGDTTSAITALAHVAVDPLTTPAFADTARREIGSRFSAVGWARELAAARDDLIREIMVGAVNVPLPTGLTVMGDDARPVGLRSALEGRISLVAFWSRDVGSAVAALPMLRAVAARLAGLDVRTVLITKEPASRDFSEYAVRNKLPAPVLHDPADAATRAFSRVGMPEFFLVDRGGRIRFRNVALDQVVRDAGVLALLGPDQVVLQPESANPPR